MSSANPAHVAATTETDFQSFSAVVLKPLLQFISTECLASLPASSLQIADFVIQLLMENKELVNQLCRGGKTSMRLEKPNPPSVSHSESLLKCRTAVSNALKRRDISFLQRVFDEHSRKEGAKSGLSVATLAQALIAADAPVVPDSEADAAAAIYRFDANCNGLMDFGEFVRAVNAPDELALFFQEKRMPALADALRAFVGRGQDQLLRVSQLSPEQMQAAASAVCSHIPHQAKSIQEELQRSFTAQFELQSQAEGDGGSKFTISKMACGRIEDFHTGLSDRVGMPHLDFKREMMREHCERAGCDTEFTTNNYKITTTPKMEWLYVAGDESGQRVPCPAEFMNHGRMILALEELRQLDLAVRAKLNDEEILALVLYTGPMFQVYNVILRRYPEENFKLFKEGGNTFATTIFVLVSAVTKVAKCTRIPEGTLLYRGLGGLMDLPDHFFNADENGASGFVDWGFMSTTSDRDFALGYSGVKQRRPKAMVMVIEVSSVDKGADICVFSQYPLEKEFLWVPCSFVQRAQLGGGRVEVVDGGLVTFVPVRVNLNLKTETVDELKEKKKRLHLVSARAMVEEVRYELGEWAKSAEAEARLQKDTSRNQDGIFTTFTLAAAILKQCEDVVKRQEAATLEEYVDDSSFRALVGEMLDTKAWAKEKKELWMRDQPQLICFLQGWYLRECHRLWQSYLRQGIGIAASGSCERASASLKLLLARSLVKQGVLGEMNADGEDVMVQAGGDGWSAMDIRAAAAAGADIFASDASGYTCVWNAARYGHKESIAALLEVKGDVNKCDNIGRSSLFVASRNGHTDCLKLLMDAGGDVNKCDDGGSSLIGIAAEKGHADCLKLLLDAGGDVNKCDNDGRSPISRAAENGHADCLELLLGAGGDVNKCDDGGSSPISIAAEEGYADCLELLLDAGGDVNKCDDDGRSPIYLAAENGNVDCLELLLDAGGDVNKCDGGGRSPISIAAEKGYADCLELLLDAGGNINKCDDSGIPPLMIAAWNGYSHIFEVVSPELAQETASQLALFEAEHSAVVELHRAADTIVISRHRGFGRVSADYLLQFQDFNTFSADVMLFGGCFYFEVHVVEVGDSMQFGFCTQGFEQRRSSVDAGVGDDQWSWAVDGERLMKFHNGTSCSFGSEWSKSDVIGFAIDMRSAASAIMSVSLNGDFTSPYGIAFSNMEAPYLSPAFTCCFGQYRVNFGDRPFAYAPVDEHYLSVHAFHKQNQQK